MFERIILLSIVFSTIGVAPAELTDKRPWEGSDAYRRKTVGDLRLSPDDDWLAFTISQRHLEDNRSYSSIWIVSARGGEPRPLTDAKGSASSPRWSPDGGKIAFFQSDEDGLGLWTMTRDGSSKTKLTPLETSNAYLGMTGNSISWSPDGKSLAFTAAGPRTYPDVPATSALPTGNDVMIVDRLLYKTDYSYSDLRRTHVWVIPSGGGQSRQISSGDFDYHSISWSPDGKWIACVSNRTGKDDFNANNDLCLLSPEGEGIVQRTRTKGPEYVPQYAPDGRHIAYLGRQREHRSKESDAELHKLYVLPAANGPAVDLSSQLDRWCHSFRWADDSSKLIFHGGGFRSAGSLRSSGRWWGDPLSGRRRRASEELRRERYERGLLCLRRLYSLSRDLSHGCRR